MTDKKAILVIGAGDATGGAIARRFAREGLTACVTRHGRGRSPTIRGTRWRQPTWPGSMDSVSRAEGAGPILPR